MAQTPNPNPQPTPQPTNPVQTPDTRQPSPQPGSGTVPAGQPIPKSEEKAEATKDQAVAEDEARRQSEILAKRAGADVSRTPEQKGYEAREMAAAREREAAKRTEAEQGWPPGSAQPAREQPTTTATPPLDPDAELQPVYSNPSVT
jgi:hypothetical protein